MHEAQRKPKAKRKIEKIAFTSVLNFGISTQIYKKA
jgi:hypothetical protein